MMSKKKKAKRMMLQMSEESSLFIKLRRQKNEHLCIAKSVIYLRLDPLIFQLECLSIEYIFI